MPETVDTIQISNQEIEFLFEILLQINDSITQLNESLNPDPDIEKINNESEIQEIDPTDTELFQLKEINQKAESTNTQLAELLVVGETLEPVNYESIYDKQIELLETIDTTMQESKEVIASQNATQQTYGMLFIPLALITFLLHWAFKKFI